MVVSVAELEHYEANPSPIRIEIQKRLKNKDKGWAPRCHQTKLHTLEITSSETKGQFRERQVDDSDIDIGSGRPNGDQAAISRRTKQRLES